VSLLHAQSPPIQHRDLKAENILLGRKGTIKLCDFGSWSDVRSDPSVMDKHATSLLRVEIERFTTMVYRPPEMVDFFKKYVISEKVDIWMLGCLLYTLMYFKHPFQDQSPLAIANACYALPPEPQYSDNLKDLTHWLLAQNPDDRPNTMQVLDALTKVQDIYHLSLTTALTQQKERQRRHEGGKSKPERHKERKPGDAVRRAGLSKNRKSSNKTPEFADAFGPWCDSPTGCSAPPWPQAAVPEPSRSWATFGMPSQPLVPKLFERHSGDIGPWQAKIAPFDLSSVGDASIRQQSASSTSSGGLPSASPSKRDLKRSQSLTQGSVGPNALGPRDGWNNLIISVA